SRDYGSYADSAIITITKEGGGPMYIPWFQTVAQVGDYGTTEWMQWSWAAPTTGTYTISMGILNDVDGNFPSWALFDGFTAVPEPSILLLLGSGLLGFGLFRRNKTV
ncbi:MAG TPA: PEP-CTERM sorting domain-containing protein, partial [Nitrospirae bacterium]|nr:PEP-CTERM sorting domain-containing protein [Nitrospirota bacterium]